MYSLRVRLPRKRPLFDELSPTHVAVILGNSHVARLPHDSVISCRLLELGEACISPHFVAVLT